MAKKAALIELRKLIHTQLMTFVESLDESERAAEGKPDDWAIKNALVHVGLWDQRMGVNVKAFGQGKPLTDWGDYNDVNAQDFEEHKGDSWDQVVALLERSQAALLAGIEALDEDQLGSTDWLPEAPERELWGRISGTCVMHPLIHMTGYLAENGKADQALEIILEISPPLAKLDDSDDWQGLIVYNKSCYYALTGQKAKALELLAKSLKLRPQLAEWSKEDPDLDSLREEPEYQALYPAEDQN